MRNQIKTCISAIYFFHLLIFVRYTIAQETDLPGIRSDAKTVKSNWEFGLEITASADTAGITATVPVPISWPEQEISNEHVDRTDNVNGISFYDYDDQSKLMVVKIARLGSGETARAVMKIALKKTDIDPPKNPADYRFAKRATGELRKYIRPSPQIESTNRKIRSVLKSIEFDEQSPAWNQVEKIHDWVRENIEYQFETTNRSCLDALEDKRGDCGEMTSLFIAICRAKKIPARAVWVPGHTYPEFYLEDENGEGHWFPCQIAGEGFEFGSMVEDRPILQKGDSFKLPGHKKATRYVRPTMIANKLTAAPVLTHIQRKIEQTQN